MSSNDYIASFKLLYKVVCGHFTLLFDILWSEAFKHAYMLRHGMSLYAYM